VPRHRSLHLLSAHLPALAVTLVGLAATGPALARAENGVIIGYVYSPNAPIDPATFPADRLTHVNYAFANVVDGQVVEGGELDAGNLAVLTGLRRTHPHLRVLVSVGGWTWSGAFSDAVLTEQSRARFVASAVDFVRRHDLDGFDVDWEYPALPGNGNVHRPEDREHFTALMEELRVALNRVKRPHRQRPLLTMAAGAFSDFLAHTEMKKVAAVTDYVNLMTYDFRVQGAGPVSGHHANLHASPLDDRHRSVETEVQAFLDAGVPARRLVVGVPFYGRPWAMASGERRGLYAPGTAPSARIDASYGPLSSELVNQNGYTRYWDDDAKAPYLWNETERIFISYEDPQSLRLKCAYIRKQRLAGAMFWQLGDDPTGALLGVLAEELR
jgi:chitinase